MTDEKEILRGDVFWGENPNATKNMQAAPRPYLIISNNYCNHYSNIVTVIPFTSQIKATHLPTHYSFKIDGKWNMALCEQITCLPKCYLQDYMTTLSDDDLHKIEKSVRIQLDLKGGFEQ